MTLPGTKLSATHREAISRGLKRFHAVPEQTAKWYEKFYETSVQNLDSYGKASFVRRKHIRPTVTPGGEIVEMPTNRRKNAEAEAHDDGAAHDNIVEMGTPPSAHSDSDDGWWEQAEVIEVHYTCALGKVDFEIGPSGCFYITATEGLDPKAVLELTHKASAFVAKHNLFRKVS